MQKGQINRKFIYASTAFIIVVVPALFRLFLLQNREEEQTENGYIEDIGIESESEQSEYIQEDEIPEQVPGYDSADADKKEKHGLMERLQSVDWANIQPRTPGDSDWQTNILLLAELPEAEITMYGYNDETYHNQGVAVVMEDKPYYFDWQYFAPRIVMPQMYWNQADRQLQITLHIYTGTGVAAEELHILRQTQEGELEDFCFAPEEYDSLLRERMDFDYDAETHRFTLIDKQEKTELCTADLSWLSEVEEGEKPVVDFAVSDIAGFVLGNEIRLRLMPGYIVEGWVSPQYDEMPEIMAEVCLSREEGQIQFSLGSIQRCFSDEELCELAGKYYAAHSENGFVPPVIEVDSEMADGQVLIHLYENFEDHTATYDWYTVDRATGIGTNLIFEAIDLSEK